MDIASLKPSERIIEIKHPTTGDNVGIRVTLISLADEKAAKIKRQIQNKSLALASRNKRFTAEDIEENEKDLLLACVVGWDWYGADVHGKIPEFTPSNIVNIFKEFPWIKSQIAEALDDEKGFFPV